MQKSIVSVTSEPLLFNNFAWDPIFLFNAYFYILQFEKNKHDGYVFLFF